MINANTSIINMINSPVRRIGARVELYSGSTLLKIFHNRDRLISFDVERLGEESKFFGFGVCQKLNVKLIDKNRELNITTENTLEALYGVESDYIYPFPLFYVAEVHRDENTNELSITAYDKLYKAAAHTVGELGLTSYTILEFATACASLLGLPLNIENVEDSVFNTYYDTGANFEGTETIRQALNAIAEATQTIYYINSNWELTFKRLNETLETALTISKDKYISLDSKTNRRLSKICSVTELGDNVSSDTGETGTTQYLRDNPFWDLRDDIATLLDNAISAVGGVTINQFNCSWRGNFLTEVGDKIALITKDNERVTAYILNDTISYNGVLSQATQWSYTDNENETESNPTSLGAVLTQTRARVDKANKTIELVASETAANTSNIASLQLNTESINASVKNIENSTNEALENLNKDVSTLTKEVEAKVTAEDVTINIKKELANGAEKVVTSTGFTFDENGLKVEKSGAEMHTLISENGMQVKRDETELLTADSEGIKATNLVANTYLIIGSNSRFEDFGADRTACFWIGG